MKPYPSAFKNSNTTEKLEEKTTLRSLMLVRIKELSNDRERWIKSIPVGMKMNNMGTALTKTLSVAQKTFYNQAIDAIDSDVITYVNEQMYSQLITNTDTSKFNEIKDETLNALKASDGIIFSELTMHYTCYKLKAVIYDLIVNYNMVDFFTKFKQELIAGTKDETFDEKYVKQHLSIAQTMLPETFFSNTLEEAKQPNYLNNLFKLRLMYDVMDAYIVTVGKIHKINHKEDLDAQAKPIIDYISSKLEIFMQLDDAYGSALTDRIVSTMISLRATLIQEDVPTIDTFDNPLALQVAELDSFINAMKRSTSAGYNDHSTLISFKTIDTNLLSVNQLSPHLVGLFWKWKRTIMQDNITNETFNSLSKQEEAVTVDDRLEVIKEFGKPGFTPIKRVSRKINRNADVRDYDVTITPSQMLKIKEIIDAKATIEAAQVDNAVVENEVFNSTDRIRAEEEGDLVEQTVTSKPKHSRPTKRLK